MSPVLAVPILLIVSLFAGAVIGAQWLRKDGDPTKRPFGQRTAVIMVSVCCAIFLAVVILTVLGLDLGGEY